MLALLLMSWPVLILHTTKVFWKNMDTQLGHTIEEDHLTKTPLDGMDGKQNSIKILNDILTVKEDEVLINNVYFYDKN